MIFFGWMESRALVCLRILMTGVLVAGATAFAGQTGAAGTKFEVSFPAAVHAEKITGRVFVFLSKKNEQEPRLATDGLGDAGLMFAADISALAAGQAGIVDGSASGSPIRSLRDVPAGDYYVQALVNVYTEFHRADGHVIWAHMDQWEGQQFNLAPGNIYSKTMKVHIDSSRKETIQLALTQVIPPIDVPPDTTWVKHLKIQSKLLTDFWGH